MIQRYTEKEMAEVWSESRKIARWAQVEWEVCRELRSKKYISDREWKELSRAWVTMKKRGLPRLARIDELELQTRHDVIAFTTALTEQLPAAGRWVHYGLTSSDVIDSAQAMAWQEAGEILLKEWTLLERALWMRARETRNWLTLGRSHGMAAEPTSFGLKFLGWQQEAVRHSERLRTAIAELRFGKISGPVGSGVVWGPREESKILARLGLLREPVSTQVIPRDRYAAFFAVAAGAGGLLERIALEIRHLSRSEVSEVRESFSVGQKGSSAMPHKRNPVGSENIAGLARLMRSYAGAGFENTALWHERDISHSSVERVIVPDACILLHYASRRMRKIIENLELDRNQISRNLERAGEVVFSGPLLLAFVRKGISREVAYRWIQIAAFRALEENRSLVDLLQENTDASAVMRPEEMKRWLDRKQALRSVDEIFKLAERRSNRR